MNARTTRPVLGRRTVRAAGALTVVVLTAMSPAGPGLVPATHVQVVGTVVNATGSVTAAAADGDGPVSATGSAPLVAAPLVSAPVVTDPLASGTSDGTGTVLAAPITPAPATATATIVPPSAPTGSGIPSTVLAAYKNAEQSLALSAPACHLPWSLLAGVGRVESGHASGGRVDDAGTTRGRILGPRLDGTNGSAVIHDTDGGALDGDTVFDRAVGPMQFIPSTWKIYGRDGNNDGVVSPHNVFDAALAAGVYLCAGGSDLSQPIPARAALMRYNNSVAYGELVLRWAAAYAAGVSVLPNAQGEVPTTTPTPPTQVPAPATDSVNAPALAAATSTTTESSSSRTSTTTTTTSSRTSETSTTTTTPTTTTTTTEPGTTTQPGTSSSVTTTSAPTTTGSATPPSSSSSATTTKPTTTSKPTSSVTVTTTPTSAPTSTGSSDPSSTSTSGSAKTSSTKSSSAKTSSTRTSSTKTSAAKTSAAKAASSSSTKATSTADGS